MTAESGWTSGDDVPVPPMWRRAVQPPFDVADRGSYDLLDYMQFTMCVGEIGVPTTDDFCRMLFDVDYDNDVDEFDYALWATRFTNPADKYEFPSQSRFGNPFMWTGQRFDADVGLYHFLYRSYSPEIGRWMQRDKLGVLELGGLREPSAGFEYSDGTSLYQYCRSSPAIRTDPNGTFSFVSMTASSGFQADMAAMTIGAGLQSVSGMKLTIYLAMTRNAVFGQAIDGAWMGSLFDTIDTLSAIGTAIQIVQLARLGGALTRAAIDGISWLLSKARGFKFFDRFFDSVVASTGGRNPFAAMRAGWVPLPRMKSSNFGRKIADAVPTNGVPSNWSKADIADAITDYQTSIASRKRELLAFDTMGGGSATQRRAHTRRITTEENFLKSLEKALEN